MPQLQLKKGNKVKLFIDCHGDFWQSSTEDFDFDKSKRQSILNCKSLLELGQVWGIDTHTKINEDGSVSVESFSIYAQTGEKVIISIEQIQAFNMGDTVIFQTKTGFNVCLGAII